MPFNPTLPVAGSEITSAELRSQLNALNDKIEASPVAGGKVGVAGLQITGNTEAGATVGLVFLKSDGLTDSSYRINYNDDTDGVLILKDGVVVAGIDASGFRVFGPAAMHAGLTLTGLPTADPHVTGKVWNDAGTVKISAG